MGIRFISFNFIQNENGEMIGSYIIVEKNGRLIVEAHLKNILE